ncbi:MAG: hypothetical protein E7130_05160 [Rikenellaceae bacterium]|nr:hypothetical protein [Rikenellaceae bacterium]
MKRVIYIATILCILLSVTGRTMAQRVALEEQIPKIKTDLWLDDKEPAKARFTYIEFVHSKTVPCIRTFLKIQDDHARFGEDLRAIIITKEDPEQISSALRECVTDYVNVAFDPEGEIFRSFGVRYVPFGIIIDHKRKALWFGNPITVSEDFFSKIKPQNNDTH